MKVQRRSASSGSGAAVDLGGVSGERLPTTLAMNARAGSAGTPAAIRISAQGARSPAAAYPDERAIRDIFSSGTYRDSNKGGSAGTALNHRPLQERAEINEICTLKVRGTTEAVRMRGKLPCKSNGAM